MSTGKMSRLAQMMGLQRLDLKVHEMKQVLPTAKDWIELEERRRTFWAAFYCDRWASSGTGWPMTIHEDEVRSSYRVKNKLLTVTRFIQISRALKSHSCTAPWRRLFLSLWP
jgi:hypothetical protein